VCLAVLNNVAAYMKHLPVESQQAQWTLVIGEMEALFSGMSGLLPKSRDCSCLLLIMATLLTVNVTCSAKAVLEPFARLLQLILQQGCFRLEHLVNLCALSTRAFGKDRGRHCLPRAVVAELVHSINLKCTCLDRNLLLVLQLAVLDAGGCIYKSAIIEEEADLYDPYHLVSGRNFLIYDFCVDS
jgi:hypothetical protein